MPSDKLEFGNEFIYTMKRHAYLRDPLVFCLNACFVVCGIIERAIEWKMPLVWDSFDAHKQFDKLSHKALVNVLLRRNVLKSIISFFVCTTRQSFDGHLHTLS